MAREKDAKDLASLAMSVDYTKLLKIEELKVEDSVEPLRKQAEAFVRCVRDGERPVVSGREGLAAVKCAEAVVESIRQHHWTPRLRPAGPDVINESP